MFFHQIIFFILSLSFTQILYTQSDTEKWKKKVISLAKHYQSDQILVYKNNIPVLKYNSKNSEPLQAMSVTKSIVAVAVGIAIDQKVIDSLDTPVSKFFKEWDSGKKRNITVRHLLNHTSGLKALSNTSLIYKSKDYVKFALDSTLDSTPGSKLFYNNKAVNILPALISKASGMSFFDFIRINLFEKLEIKKESWSWHQDPSGNYQGMAGLIITANALLKIGSMLINEGNYKNHRVLSKKWITQMLNPSQEISQNLGLLWWRRSDYNTDSFSYDQKLINEYKKLGLDKKILSSMEKLIGQKMQRQVWVKKMIEIFGSMESFKEFTISCLKEKLPFGKLTTGPVIFYSAEGYLGQYLILIPSKKIVGVHLIDPKSTQKAQNFPNFGTMLSNL